VAVKYLARKGSSVIGMIGAGRQAETQLLVISKVLPKIEEVIVYKLYGLSDEEKAVVEGQHTRLEVTN
jgi:ornithine cyclodeaminase/alanine dehydrogenase-like protein (mu-crystallin family)